MDLQAYKGVAVFAEQVDGKISPIAYELIGEATRLAAPLNTDVTAILVGKDVKGLADKLAAYGANKVVVVEDDVLENYTTEPYTHAVATVINEIKPEIVLVGASALGRDLAPRVSARVKTGLTADCTILEVGDFKGTPNQLLMTRPAFGGNTIATIACPDNRPQMATVRPGVMKKLAKVEGAKANLVDVAVTFEKNNKYVEVMEIVKHVKETVNIMDAKILVSGGRGVGTKEGFQLLEEVADVLGATVSCSRPISEAGILDHDRQVGQTGKTVRPELYIAVGISGAIQHVAGMEESDIIIAINKDETAPIFDVATYGIVGDYSKILPILAEQLKVAIAEK